MLYFWRMFFFLTIAGFLALILFEQIKTAFMSNPGLNGLIGAVLLVGVLYCFRQIFRLYPEINWLNSFRFADPALSMKKPPVLLAPMAAMLRDRAGHLSLSTVGTRSILDSIGNRLDEARDTSRYLVGLLVFLGLLGTFWGLLETINSVGKTISALGTGGGETGLIFEELKTGLQAPLSGMGTAFSSSLFGLAGSLILGFLDLQASQAQNRFYNELEDWLSGMTQLAVTDQPSGGSNDNQLAYAMQNLQTNLAHIANRIDMSMTKGEQSSESVRDLAKGLEGLVHQMREEQKIVRQWLDEQASQQSDIAETLRNISRR